MTTIDAMHGPSAPEQNDSMIVMLVAYGWEECAPLWLLAMPQGEISIRFFRNGPYTAYTVVSGTDMAMLRICRIGLKGRIRKIFRLHNLPELDARLLAISQEVAS